MGEYKELNVACPVCQAEKSINVPEAIFGQKKFGTFKIQVPSQAVCDHTFIVFVDTKGIIRGYEKIDIMMATPTAVSKTKEESSRVTLKTFIDFFGLYGLFSLIHAKIFNYPAYVLKSDEKGFENIGEIMNRIGDRLLPEKYRGTSDLQFLEPTEYGKIKVKEKDALIIDAQKNILQTPWEEKLKFEESIIKKALEIFDDEEQMIILEQEIAKLAKEAEVVNEILEPVKEMYEDNLTDELARKLMIPKIHHYRLTLIKEFIKRRFSEKTACKIKNKVEEFLGLI
ncbi:MAG: hypothetical protein ACTSR8_04730 [Promethearchaeota archaeon]